MSEFWYVYNYLEQKNLEKSKLCYMYTESFIIYLKTKEIYVDIEKVVEIRLYTSNYKLGRSLSKWKNKKVIGLKDEWCERIIRELAALRSKTYR